MSNLSFNPVIAQLYGVDEAVFLQNVYFWIEKNRVNNRHFYDDDYWTYNSVSAFSKLFPFWTTRQIERIIKKLEKEGVLKIGNYNSSAYDRTRWFALTEKINSIYENGVTHLRENVNQNTQKDKPIPDSNTDGKQQIVNTDSKPVFNNVHFDKFWEIYDKKIDRKSCEKLWAKINPSEEEAVKIVYAAGEYVKTVTDKQYQKHPKTWLNNESWNNDLIISNGATQNVTKHQITTNAASAIFAAAVNSPGSQSFVLPDNSDLRSSVVAEFPNSRGIGFGKD
jgi:hypothetical protein